MNSKRCTSLASLWLACASCAPGSSVAPEPAAPAAQPAASPQLSEEQDSNLRQARAAPDYQAVSNIFLSALPVTASEQAKQVLARADNNDSFAKALRVTVRVHRGYDTLGELTRRTKSQVVDGTLELPDLSELHATDSPTKTQKQSSFIVDYDESSLAKPAAHLQGGANPSPAEIAAFVSRYIGDKTYTRGFDIASRVATTRSGDCTEHAVLTAALVRRFGFPARVVLGVVLAGVRLPGEKPELWAAGHAWVEHFQDERWHIVDAALYLPNGESDADTTGIPGLHCGAQLRFAYLPINVVKEEGPGYARALMEEPGVDAILRMEVEAATDAAQDP